MSRFANTTSKEFAQVAGHLDAIIKETERLSAAGVDTAAVLEDAFSKAIDSAETQAEINQVVARMNDMAAAGKLATDQVDRLFTQTGARLASFNAGMRQASEAAQALGVDLGQFAANLTPEFIALDAQLDRLIAHLDDLEEEGIDTGA
ncbi:MAG: hypothetical protein LBO00_04025, partial [Zoogloeaceae bacterium]|nr:hypothetical protein [Zoogloeaceae bacterium]